MRTLKPPEKNRVVASISNRNAFIYCPQISLSAVLLPTLWSGCQRIVLKCWVLVEMWWQVARDVFTGASGLFFAAKFVQPLTSEISRDSQPITLSIWMRKMAL